MSCKGVAGWWKRCSSLATAFTRATRSTSCPVVKARGSFGVPILVFFLFLFALVFSAGLPSTTATLASSAGDFVRASALAVDSSSSGPLGAVENATASGRSTPAFRNSFAASSSLSDHFRWTTSASVSVSVSASASASASADTSSHRTSKPMELQHQNTWVLCIVTSALLCLALCLRLSLTQLHKKKALDGAANVSSSNAGSSMDTSNARYYKVLAHALEVSFLVILWYAIAIGMTLFNRWFLRDFAHSGFPFSTTMTCLNMFTKFLLSRLVDACSISSNKIKPLASRPYWRLAVPIGLCTAVDIMLSNYSLFYVTVTFYTIVKSGGNVWNLLFSILLGHQRASCALFSVIVLISSGIALGSFGSTEFNYHGFWLVLLASIIGTLKWVLTQSLLKQMDPGSNRIIAVVYYISPASAFGLVPIVLATETKPLLQSKFVQDLQLGAVSLALILCGGCLAFALIFIEITLVKKTSALSLGIAGSFKDVTQVLLAVMIFHDRLSAVNAFGLVLATCGMLLYTLLKNFREQESEESTTTSTSSKYAQLPTTSLDTDIDTDAEIDGHGDSFGFEDAQVQEICIESRPLATSLHETQLKRRESKDFDDDVPLGAQIV